jgi:phage virion morphogenesis protein
MNGPFPTVVVDDSRLKYAIARLLSNGRNATSAFEAIGEMLRTSAVRNCETQGRYGATGQGVWKGGSNKWKKLAPSTVKRRGNSGPILAVSADLRNSISAQAHGGGVTIGTNVPYARAHQFGTDKAGRSHSVKIPARPFLVIQDEDIDDALDIIARHLTRGVK